MNCHLVPEWTDELEYLVDDLSLETTNPDFRLWITTRPHPGFSVPTLQAGVKLTLEEPSTLKTSLVRHLAPDKAFAAAFNARTDAYRKMCFAIALFHAAINERGNYSQVSNSSKLHIFLSIVVRKGMFFSCSGVKINCRLFAVRLEPELHLWRV